MDSSDCDEDFCCAKKLETRMGFCMPHKKLGERCESNFLVSDLENITSIFFLSKLTNILIVFNKSVVHAFCQFFVQITLIGLPQFIFCLKTRNVKSIYISGSIFYHLKI